VRKIGLVIYIVFLVYNVVRALISVIRRGKTVPRVSGCEGWYYIVLRDEMYNCYFITDLSRPSGDEKILMYLIQDLKYRILFYKNGTMVDSSDLILTCWYHYFSTKFKFVILDEVPLEEFSKQLIRKVYNDLLDEYQR